MVSNRIHRSGYSLLEVVIAMTLLVGLLAAGWSLLGNYRDAEMRGWSLVQRVQAVQVTRRWLEDDLLHVIPLKTDVKFVGDSTGFRTTIRPSIDPVPFLDQLFGGEVRDGLKAEPVLEATSNSDLANAASTSVSVWPPDQLMIEYRLEPSQTDSQENTESESTAQLNEPQFGQTVNDVNSQRSTLIRREFAPVNKSVERELTLSDLYRTQEDSNTSPSVVQNQRELPGLVRPKFAYFDGQNWKVTWDSTVAGQMPSAVALSFDVRDPGPNADANVMDEEAPAPQDVRVVVGLRLVGRTISEVAALRENSAATPRRSGGSRQ